ncbi:MAG: hypothetical protein COC17_01390 [Hyphomicrobiales bacterium]|nr:tripartite tricarboxylate transporter TctB family protein [Hyphomicrobiales bacterium]PCH51298.1 MAG: hypothetical protein COC17_01390 [Hyphomicrobiales bacterium]
MINADRLQGVIVLGFGCALLLWLVPAHVTSVPGDPLDPSLFPKVAGWIIATLGLLLVVFARSDSAVPARQEVFGILCFITALVVAALFLPVLGFLPVACGLMIASLLLLRERRPIWAALTLVGVPFFVWFLFVVLLGRPLS